MVKRASVALIPLLLLPNFLFLVPLAPIAEATQVPSSPGVPLPPGTVTARNTWNLTQTCPKVTSPAEPLLAKANGWSTTLRIPTQLFMGSPQGSYITQTFALTKNGTFTVSDDHGNSFSLKVPTTNLGTALVNTLVGNSTTAVQETTASTGPVISSDVKLKFSVYKQFCQPAGVRLEISGTANWGPSSQGTVKLVFDKKPVQLSSYRAMFANSSGYSLGFDWSDSKAHSPVFDSKSSALSYQVGTSFYIDPVTVGTSSDCCATYLGYQGHVLNANGLWWVFYYDGTQFGYRSSRDGLTWSSETTLVTGGWPSNGNLATFVKGTVLYYAASNLGQKIYFRYGTLNPDGTISWGITEGSFTTNYSYMNEASTTVDSNGNWWVAVNSQDYAGDKLIEAWSCANPSSCSWTFSSYIDMCSPSTCLNISYVQLVPLTGGKLAAVYQNYADLGVNMRIRVYSSGWSNPAMYNGGGYLWGGGCTAIGDTTECVFGKGSHVIYQSATSAPSWNSFTSIAESPLCQSSTKQGAISTDGNSQLAIEYDCGGKFYYSKSSNGGLSWTIPQGLSAGSSSPTSWISMPMRFAGNFFAAVYVQGHSNPYNVNFDAIPFTIPTAALSSNVWSRPGLSPYETYFTHFSDYVSPGNGLLAAELGTLSLPGRGIDLNPALVYSAPYGFRSNGSPYLYDNYTGAGLGYGWSLNFPWLGKNYLHLTDGQAYPYSWIGSTYHGPTDFVLVNNTGTSYTLTLKDGTHFQFDSTKKLTSEADHTGNNTISFSYGTNGYISQIADTINRIVTFSYNANNQLTTITSGTRSWTLGYSGNNLVSLSDPLSRTTSFKYLGTSGANSWLLNRTTYPTTGKTAYSYQSKPIGTEVNSYYVNSRNIYSSPTQLTRSDQINYTTLNGVVTWSHMKTSDGYSVQSYQNFNFQTTPKNLMKLFDANPTNQTIRVTENDYDILGRINATKIISPSNTVLATTTRHYDNWGNVVYLKDNIGQQTWFSYANTNSSGSFGSSGCSTSFYTQTISSNIDNLLVGQCDYQNGSGTPQQQTYYKYDRSGNLLELKVLHSGAWIYIDHTYDRYGNVITTTDALGRVSYFRYSSTYSSAYLTKKSILVGSQNVTTTYTYNSTMGFMLSQTNPNGQTTSYKYDVIGRNIRVTYPAVGGVVATKWLYYYDNNNTMKIIDGNGHVAKEYFDGLARQTKVERWNGSSVYSSQTYTYGWLDLVATKITAAGNTYTYTYDQDGRLTKLINPDTTYSTTSYDDVNNLKTAADENGHQTIYVYDWNQRLTSAKQYNSSTNYFLTTYSYDLSGNQLTTTDAKTRVTSYAYDDLNRLTTTTFPDTKTETRTYDNLGNLATRTTPNGSQIQYTTYDQLNRLTKVTYPGSGGTVTYTYDPDSNRLSMVNPSATNYYSYDARDRLTNSTEYVGGVKYQTLYQYDKARDVTQITYPDGGVFSATYDGVNRLKTAWGFATLGYTVDDKISKITYGNGEVATYAYDNRDRPTQIQDKYGSTKEMSLNYTYDGTGNVLTLNTETYHYDWLNRLNYSSGPWGTYKYTYDQVGNRIKMVQGTTTTLYTYGKYYRIKSAGSVTYTNDTNGNMATKNDGTSWTFNYDYENRLTKVVHSGTTVQTNSYDGDGNRVKQVAGSSTFTYSYQGLNILYDKNVTGGTTTLTKHFYAGGLQVGKMVGSTRYYFHQDALGSTRLVATSTVTIKFSSNYIPYGQNYAVSGKEVFQYTGKPYDTATGLYYEGARYYDPTTGRFTIQDSVTGTQDDPMSLNRYIYARDNPERYIDPNGHDFWSSLSSGISSLGGAVTSTISSGLTGLVGDVTSVSSGAAQVASAVTNAWNSLPPSDQAIIAAVAVTTAAVVVTVATGGAAAPWAMGAAFGADSSLITGLVQGNANAATVLSSAAIGAISGGLGASVGVLGGAAVGAAATFANQQVTSVIRTGHLAPVTLASVTGVALGAAIGGSGSFIGDELAAAGGPAWGSNSLRSIAISGGSTTIASMGVSLYTPIPFAMRSVLGTLGPIAE